MNFASASTVIAGILIGFSFTQAYAQPYTFSSVAGLPGTGGSVDGTNGNARLNAPAGMAIDASGNIYFADPNAIRQVARVGTNWVVTTLAGSILNHGTSDGTNASASFNYPQSVTVDGAGDLYVADTYNNTIRRITASGTNWIVSTIAGSPGQTGSADGIAADSSGNVFVADTLNDTIRRVARSGTNWSVITIAGLAGTPGSDDGVNAAARFRSPASVAVDSDGTLYISDFGNNTIRKLSPSGNDWVVTTFAGSPGNAGSADGQGSLARFNQPQGLAVDATHQVYVADSANSTIRRITPAGFVSTIAGLAGTAGSSNGTGSAARFRLPTGIAVDSAGTVYVSDSLDFTIRQGMVVVLQIARLNTQAVLSWPTSLSGYTAQYSGSLSGSWQPLPGVVGTWNEHFVMTNNIAPGAKFYRLFKEAP